MIAETKELLQTGLHHLARFAFDTKENPFLSMTAVIAPAVEEFEHLGDLLESGDTSDWLENEVGQHLISRIQLRCVPRDLQLVSVDGTVGVGVESSHAYFHAPPFWWLVAHLWCIEVGRKFETHIPDHIIGYRLHPDFVGDPASYGRMFRDPKTSYRAWRHQFARATAERFPDEVLSATTLDLASFYYSVSATPSSILQSFRTHLGVDVRLSKRMRVLTELLDSAHVRYAEQMREVKPRPDLGLEVDATALPVGLPSSPVLANLIMSIACRDLHALPDVVDVATFADDVIVLSRELQDVEELPSAFVRRIGVSQGEDPARLNSAAAGQLAAMVVGPDKIGVGYATGVEIAQAAVDNRENDAFVGFALWDAYERGSENHDWGGRLTTVLRAPHRRDRIPHQIVKDLREVIDEIRSGGLQEETTQRLTEISDEIDDARFLALRPHWSELLIANISTQGEGSIWSLTDNFVRIASAIRLPPNAVAGYRRATLSGLRASWIQAVAEATAICFSEGSRRRLLDARPELIEDGAMRSVSTRGVVQYAARIRASALISPSLVSVPLAELSGWTGSLIGRDMFDEFLRWARALGEGAAFGELLLNLRSAPRFVSLHEVCLAVHMWAQAEDREWLEGAFELLNAQPLISGNAMESMRLACDRSLAPGGDDGDEETVRRITDGEAADEFRFRVAIPSAPADPSRLEDLIAMDHGRLAQSNATARGHVRQIVSTSIARECDVLVLPEWSVIAEQLLWLMERARSSQMFVVAGAMPAIDANQYSNRLWIGVPIEDEKGHRFCLVPPPREKRHLSPAERETLSNHGVQWAGPTDSIPSYSWRGVGFSSLLCFEFADISIRDEIASRTDFLTVSSLNRDWRYFDAIQESATRDVYCLTVCTNAGQFPGTRIMRPTTSDKSSVASIHGSDDATVVSHVVDMTPIVAARRAWIQPRHIPGLPEPTDGVATDDYKPLPPQSKDP